MELSLNIAAQKAIRILESRSFHAYIVGGCVRDMFLSRDPQDWDITTDALPPDILDCFDGYKILKTGMKHGTVTVFIDSTPLEITTHRIDGNYSDSRRPDTVTFTENLKEDLKRRDFTINAIAYHPSGQIYDFFDGEKDIKQKVIRCVGDADVRFSEDALRILRALRFSSQLGFSIDALTAESIHKNAALLGLIARERIGSEFSKLLLGQNVEQVLANYWDVFERILPSFDYDKDTWEHTASLVQNAPHNLVIRLALLIYPTVKVKADGEENVKIKCHNMLRALSFNHKTSFAVISLLLAMDREVTANKIDIKVLLNLIGKETFERLIDVWKVMVESDEIKQKSICAALDVYHQILENNECFSLKQLAINGSDLIELGIKNGKEIGDKLNALLQMVIEEKIENNKAILIAVAETIEQNHLKNQLGYHNKIM